VKTIDEILPKLNASEHAWLSRHVKENNWTVEDLCKDLLERKGLGVDPASLEEFLRKKGLSPVRSSADSGVEVHSRAQSSADQNQRPLSQNRKQKSPANSSMAVRKPGFFWHNLGPPDERLTATKQDKQFGYSSRATECLVASSARQRRNLGQLAELARQGREVSSQLHPGRPYYCLESQKELQMTYTPAKGFICIA
jgi:hypothetical protein